MDLSAVSVVTEDDDVPALIALLLVSVISWVVVLGAYIVALVVCWARAIQLYIMAAFSPIPLSLMALDDTRQIVAAFDLVRFDRQRQLFVMDDPFIGELDVVAINKYMGWYHPWPLTPDKAVWDVARGKPLIISEFGGEALYGQHGPADVASSWSEEYQEALYRDNLRMFENIPNLRGVSPWILFDFRSPFRFHPANQEGWNRKGLVSDQGYRKKAWYLMKAYYDKH